MARFVLVMSSMSDSAGSAGGRAAGTPAAASMEADGPGVFMQQKTSESGSAPGDLLLTGATGFLGSHTLVEWLRRYPGAQACCLVRGPDPAARVRGAVAGALEDAGAPGAGGDLLRRITVLGGDLRDGAFARNRRFAAWMRTGRPTHVVHCAAKLSFQREDRERVFAANVDGTKALWDALAAFSPVASMNHVSTAYVAGTREGVVRERETAPPPGFNNPYEESKWEAEHLAWRRARAQGVGTRIFRPSIIIGHSTTYRSSSDSGLYKIVEMLQRLRRLVQPTAPVRVQSNPEAALDLVPVDLVVGEMLDIIERAAGSLERTFHLTSERALSVGEIFAHVSPVTGVRVECSPRRPPRGDRLGALYTRLFRPYLPYLMQDRTFDRANARACAVTNRQARYTLDLPRLSRFVQAHLDKLNPAAAPARAEEGAAA